MPVSKTKRRKGKLKGTRKKWQKSNKVISYKDKYDKMLIELGMYLSVKN